MRGSVSPRVCITFSYVCQPSSRKYNNPLQYKLGILEGAAGRLYYLCILRLALMWYPITPKVEVVAARPFYDAGRYCWVISSQHHCRSSQQIVHPISRGTCCTCLQLCFNFARLRWAPSFIEDRDGMRFTARGHVSHNAVCRSFESEIPGERCEAGARLESTHTHAYT